MESSITMLRLGPFFALVFAASLHVPHAGAVAQTAWAPDLDAVRQAAWLIPGRRPLRLNFVKFAESRRTKNFSVKGAPASPSVQARTAFQVVYPDSYVMVDAGMDQDVHRFFGRGVEEPYDSASAAQLERAVAGARLIVVTHEHGDHVAGVIRPGSAATDAATRATKTILTRAQVDVLRTRPQMPEIRLTEDAARRFVVVDYDHYFSVAPGLVLIKAAGHTPGSQMVYVALESGREYLLIGDTTWHMDGVRLIQGKDAPWVTEDERAVLDQLRWLHDIIRTAPQLVVVASHDDEQHAELVRAGRLSNRLELDGGIP
jgi:glyoxylase-like metal-dependent hydrolase (beta-lactamase superfamily II)